MKIAVIGAGTSGNAIIPKLDGDLLVVDRDIVEESNLERQAIYVKSDIAQPKALVIGEKFSCEYKVLDLNHNNVDILKGFDLVIDCTDNLYTRFLLNDFCVKENIPWIYTGVVGDRARVMVVNGSYCFRCLFSEVKGLDTCSTAGVSIELAQEMAKVVVQEITFLDDPKGLWANGEWMSVRKSSDCPTCNGNYEYLEGKQDEVIQFCGSSRYQFRGNFDYSNVRERLGGKGDWFVFEDFYIFKDRVLVKASSESEAKEKFTKVIGC
jgi:molybdopterin-synthase adenylyltransferase